MKRFALWSVLMLGGTVLAQPAPTPPPAADPPEAKDVRAAAKAFAAALGDPDAGKVRALFAGTPEDAKLAEAMHASMQASARFRAAAIKAFPDLAKKPQSDDMTVAGMQARLDRDPVQITGDEAAVGVGGLKLKRVDGKWRVVDVVAIPQAKPMVAALTGSMTTVMNQTTPEIEAGRYKTMEEMQAALKERMQAAAAKNRPAGRPATRPSK